MPRQLAARYCRYMIQGHSGVSNNEIVEMICYPWSEMTRNRRSNHRSDDKKARELNECGGSPVIRKVQTLVTLVFIPARVQFTCPDSVHSRMHPPSKLGSLASNTWHGSISRAQTDCRGRTGPRRHCRTIRLNIVVIRKAYLRTISMHG